MNQKLVDSPPILLIRQLRAGHVPGVVHVDYVASGKVLGQYTITHIFPATLKLSRADDSAPHAPIYVPNPLNAPCSIEVSADGRTFVSIMEDSVVIFKLTFHNIPTQE
jgi:hypothetical protein